MTTKHTRLRTALVMALTFHAGSIGLAQEDAEEIFELSPFEVDASSQGYHAENTLAGSRLNMKVSDLAASITVVTMEQMEDTASTDINDIFRYEANTEGASTYTPAVQSLRNDGVVDTNSGFTHGGAGQPQTVATSNRIRGLGQPSTAVNNYPSIDVVPFDAYNTQSVEISRGPNSMLFGMGSPAGVVNQNTASATLNHSSNSVSLRIDDRGSFRSSFSFNRGLIEDKLAIFGAAVLDEREFRRKPSYDDTQRYYGAITYKPFEKTKLRLSFEDYSNDQSRPNSLTPRDSVTQWVSGGMWGYNPSTGMLRSSATGEEMGPIAQRSGSPRIEETRAFIESRSDFNPAHWNEAKTQYNGVNIYGGSALTDPASALYTPGMAFANTSRPKYQIVDGKLLNMFYPSANKYYADFPATGRGTFGPSDADIFADPADARAYDVSYSASDFYTARNNGVGSYRYPGVTNQAIYDWESINTLQMNFGQYDNTTTNLEFEQSLTEDLLFSAGYFKQDYESVANYTVSQLNVATLYVDTNTHYADGSPNPMFGQTYLYDFDPDQFINTEENENSRAMLAWTPDFTDSDGWSRWLGRHQALGLVSRNDRLTSLTRERWFILDSEEDAKDAIFLSNNPNDAGWSRGNRSAQRNYYLSYPGSQPYGVVQQASGVFPHQSVSTQMQYYDWENNSWDQLGITQGYYTWHPTSGRNERIVDTTSIGLTSYLWNERIITTLGWRKDDYKARSTTTGAILDADGNEVEPGLSSADMYVNGEFQIDKVFDRWNRWDELSGSTNTTGIVVRPFDNWDGIDNQFLQSIGFTYNESDNFNPPPAVQVDAFGNQLPKPTGEGKDWGIQFSLLDNKLFARINFYEASNNDERTNPGTSISRLTGNVDTTLFRNWARTIALINRGHDPRDTETFGAGLSPAEEESLETEIGAIWQQPHDYYNDLPGSIYATRDAVSEGTELQVVYNPTENWTMKLTGGKQETRYSDVLKEFDAWYDVRNPVWTSARAQDHLLPEYQQFASYTTTGGRPVDLTTFWQGYGYESNVRLDNPWHKNAQEYYDVIVAPQYAIASDLDGQAAPGQRKYRASFLTNYHFNDGVLDGFGLGGSLRWEDKAVIGYYGKPNGPNATDLTLSDITRPIYDEANNYVDLWISYARPLSDTMDLKVQLNIQNALESGGLQTVGVNFDGSANAFRILDPRQFVLTTTLNF